jgi:hypothetical protein
MLIMKTRYPPGVRLAHLPFKGSGDSLAPRDLGQRDDRDNQAGEQHGPHIGFQLFTVFEIVDHHEIDDHIFKVLENKEHPRLQIHPSEHRAEKRGRETDQHIVGNRPVQRGPKKESQILVDRHPGEPAEPYDSHKQIVHPEGDAASQGGALRAAHDELRAQEHGKNQYVEGDLSADETHDKEDHPPCKGQGLGGGEARDHHGESDEDEEQEDEREDELKRRVTSLASPFLGKESVEDHFHQWAFICREGSHRNVDYRLMTRFSIPFAMRSWRCCSAASSVT